jgi:dTDP-glucose 4,6-dehydratase
MRILVAGGAGFIGSHYVRSLLSDRYLGFEDAHVTVFDRLTYAGSLANLHVVTGHPRFTFVHGDITDGRLLVDVLPGHDVIINFAAETHVDRSISRPGDFVMTNVYGTQRLLHAALYANVRTVIQVSTDEVYGSIAEESWIESDPLLPNSPYAASKAGADLLCRAFNQTYGLDVRVTRCSNNYGPYQYPEKIIPLFITRLIDGRCVPLYGDGEHVREWLHVEDHCRGIQLVLTKGANGEVYNIGGGIELTNRQLTDRLLTACDRDWSMVDNVPDRLGHDRRYSVDSRKIQEIGFAPSVDFDEGLAEVVQWYFENQHWWRCLTKGDHGGR